MSLFNTWKYSEALIQLFEERKLRYGRWTLSQMAKDLGIQASYITNVLKERAHFNSDQLYSIAEYMHLRSDERDYLLLLLEWERAAHPKRKAEFKEKIQEFQKKQLKTEKHLSARVELASPEAGEYYLNPLCQLVHVFLNFKEFAKDPEKLCSKLGISRANLGQHLETLERLKYVQRTKNGYEVLKKNKHLPKESPLCFPHQTLFRYKSLDHMQRLPEKDRYSFSVTFSSSQSDKDCIHSEFLNFIKKAESIVRDTKREEVYQIHFDLFPWSLE